MLTWICRCPLDQFRDGPAAVADATTACQLSDWQVPDYLESLGAAHAECGDFASAIQWQSKAIELAADNPVFLIDARAILEGYRSGKPHREAPKAP